MSNSLSGGGGPGVEEMDDLLVDSPKLTLTDRYTLHLFLDLQITPNDDKAPESSDSVL